MEKLLAALTPNMCLTIDELAASTGRPYVATVDALRAAHAAGTIRCSERGCYELTGKGKKILAGEALKAKKAEKLPPLPRYRDTRQQRIWNAARALKKFSCRDLTLYARHDDEVPKDFLITARQYTGLLRRAGFLVTLDVPDRSGKRAALRFRLARDTGPFAPSTRHNGIVYDRNTKEEHNVRGD